MRGGTYECDILLLGIIMVIPYQGQIESISNDTCDWEGLRSSRMVKLTLGKTKHPKH